MQEGVTIGQTNFRSKKTKFGIKIDDRRRHVYIIGKTGTGKSTLEENMAIEDIRAGRGVGIVDPHGEFAERVLEFVPENRLDDVIYFNPHDMENPIAFNPLERIGDQFSHLVASALMAVFEKIWADAWSERMKYILNNTLLALLELPNSTLLGIMRMLAEKEYRKKVVANLKDPVVKGFWVNEFGSWNERFATEAVAAIQNKVGQFVSNPLVRNIIGQSHSTIDFRKIMDEKKIFIANLSKGKIGEDNSALLGAMIVTKMQFAAMSRVDVPESQRSDFHLYIDEFQNFSTESFASILSEARKYHLCLTLAHQYIAQLSTKDNTIVRDAIFGNVGTLVLFRIGAEDAEFLEKEFEPEFMANDLINLPKHNIYVKLMVDGVTAKAFSAETLPPYEKPIEIFKDVIIKNSQTKYGVPQDIVERKIAAEWSGKAEMVEEKVERRMEQPLEKVLRPKKERKQVVMDELRAVLDKSLSTQKENEEKKETKKEGDETSPQSFNL